MTASCLLAFAALAFQPPGAPPPAEMKQIDWLVGEWKGTGWMQAGPKKENFTVHEKLERKLDGHVFLVEGQGKDSAGKVVHHALAFFHFDRPSKEFRVKAFRKDGGYVDAKGEMKDGAFVWGFADPRGPTVRFTLTKNDKGQWHEKGEVSMDKGNSWTHFLDMTLDRVK